MTWEDCEEALYREMDLLQWERLQDFDAPWDRANWTLHHEKVHETELQSAFERRLNSGAWPPGLSMTLRYLVALRLIAIRERLATLEAWGVNEPQSVEELIEKLGLRGWHLIRYDTHLEAAQPSLVASVDDPWDDFAPPVWMQ